MKATAFAYAKPASLAEALELLERPGAKVLAGGQSLIPSLNMRLSSPELLVDITGLQGLRGVSLKNATLSVGALTTHAEIEKSSEIKAHVPLLAEAAPHIAHPAIRNRGTIGGSLALADPAAEYPACAVALNATLVLESRKGKRKILADRFFKGLFETDLKPVEILVAVEFPAAKKDDKSVFLELARRHGDYATVGLAAHNERVVFFGVASVPVFVSLHEAKAFVKEKLQPDPDLYHSRETKRHLAGVLLERAWTTLSTSR
ncbi:MAG TPA: xanthine dehydrogenase family protein subunit M [Burkholderiales bacterium]|nr:xanthine dehydrogenase family protein subunit M [Burkholderiales bacterium]